MGGTAFVHGTVIDDNNLEGDHSFTLIIGSTSNDLITINSTASAIDVTIMDNESMCVCVRVCVCVCVCACIICADSSHTKVLLVG